MNNISISYLEFPATSIELTKNFYGKTFGWEFVDYGPNYVAFEGAGLDGGFSLDSKPSPNGGVLVVLYCKELETLQSKIADFGCDITRAIFPFPGGRRFHFIDPNGNELAVWSE